MSSENLHKKLNEDLRTATLAHNTEVVRVLRFCKAMLDSAAKELKVLELGNPEAEKIIGKKIKQSRDAEEQFKKGGRQDLAQSESREIEILSAYLPKQLSDQELGELVEKTIAETGASGKKDFARVMGTTMKAVAGRADGARVKQTVEQKLE